MWQSNKLTFSSDDPIVDVTYAGQLIINDYDYNKQAVITVKTNRRRQQLLLLYI